MLRFRFLLAHLPDELVVVLAFSARRTSSRQIRETAEFDEGGSVGKRYRQATRQE